MQKWEYCGIFGISFDHTRIMTDDFTHLIVLSPCGYRYIRMSRDVINSSEKGKRIYLTLERIVMQIKDFISINMDLNEIIDMPFLKTYGGSYADELRYDENFKKFTDQLDWEHKIGGRVLELLLSKLIYQGWELMDHDGYWFKKNVE